MVQVLQETTSEYHYFVSQLLAGVKKNMGEECTIRLYKVTKNNSLELDSLVLQKEGKNFAPNIYLQPYYEAYRQGVSIRELVERLCNRYRNSSDDMNYEQFNYTFEDMKTNIIYRLVSYERNRRLLAKIPHIKYLDLAIIFYCLVRNDENGIGTIRITNEHMENWNVPISNLQKIAADNTQRLFPFCIRSMDEVMEEIRLEEQEEKTVNEPKGSLEVPESAQEQPKELQVEAGNTKEMGELPERRMYILSNRKGINGASCLLYPNVLQDFSDYVGSDFYILPSSIHELILVTSPDLKDSQEYAAMVRDINETQVAAEEVLSDRVYFYSRTEGLLLL